jgi:glycosyltransferase involved in cell wall biosynthesis
MKRYRIGVDARLLAEPVTGIGRYLHEILSRLVNEGHEWYLYSHKPIIIGNWKRENVRIKNLNINGRVLRMLWAQTILPYWAYRDNLDIFWSPSHRLPRYLPASIASVVTIHDLVWKYAGDTMRPLSRWLDSKFMIEASEIATVIIAVSNSTARDLCVENKEFEKKVFVIPLGATNSLLPKLNQELQEIKDSKQYFLFVGTLEPRKNLLRLIEAMSTLPKYLKDSADLIIVGGKGWGRLNIHVFIEKLNLKNNVKILGYTSDDHLRSLYSGALFLVMPSLYEGFGLPLVEAMAWGVPSLTSNISSMPEVIGNAGILVNPLDVKSIAYALEKLLTDRGYLQTLSKNAFERSGQFNWDVSAKKTIEIFEFAFKKNNL